MPEPVSRIKDIQWVSVKDLKPHPKNRNKHPEEQIERLAEIIDYQGWRYPIKVSNQSGFITAGHGRLMAAKLRGWDQVPVSFQDYDSDDQEYADVQADNAIASWAELDLSSINLDLQDLGPDFNLDMLGLKNFSLDFDINNSLNDQIEYSKKIEAPIYEPKGEKPAVSALYDYSKSESLLSKIEAAELSDEIRSFLKFAAYRHIVFDYEKIAEFYSHANKDIQELMEDSALVIIDFNKAIENGFIQMTKEIASAYPTELDSE